MPTEVIADLTMCTDCAHTIANGIDHHDDDARAHMLAMFEHTRDWSGTIVVGEHTDDFSARECDTCGTVLAGDRYDGVLLSHPEPVRLLVQVS